MSHVMTFFTRVSQCLPLWSPYLQCTQCLSDCPLWLSVCSCLKPVSLRVLYHLRILVYLCLRFLPCTSASFQPVCTSGMSCEFLPAFCYWQMCLQPCLVSPCVFLFLCINIHSYWSCMPWCTITHFQASLVYVHSCPCASMLQGSLLISS